MKRDTWGINEIRQDLGIIKRKFETELPKQAEKDLIDAQEQIVKNFYSSYKPHMYKRTESLKNIMTAHTLEVGRASITVSDANLSGHKATNDYIFNRIWNEGFREFPQTGSTPLSHTFKYYMYGHLVNWGTKGEIWTNKHWSGGPNNIFKTSITIGSLTTINGSPDMIMTDLVNHWDLANGLIMCEKIKNSI